MKYLQYSYNIVVYFILDYIFQIIFLKQYKPFFLFNID